MKKNRRRKDIPPIDFWQSATDLSLALTLMFLLVTSLLLMLILRLPENQRFLIWGTLQNIQEEDSYQGDGGDDEFNGGDWESDDSDDEDNHNNTSGGDGEYAEVDDEYHEQYPIPSGGGEDWRKAAVYVTVIDAETLRAIREENITFELYEEFNEGLRPDTQTIEPHGAIRFLNTYYPVKIEYRDYQTTEDGTYYLPEKIEEGDYYFKEITEPEGYDSAGTIRFNVDDNYEWADPYVVSVPLYPSKNIIYVRLIDSETGEQLTSGEFTVTAAEQISTVDGTVRYITGQEADTFAIQEDGTGASKELYLGEYLVAQKTTPAYYTTSGTVTEATVAKRDGLAPQVYDFFCEKTAISVWLGDDVTHQPLEGATFNLLLDNAVVQTATTDASGTVVFTNLDKNANYTVRQVSAPEGYQIGQSDASYYVDNAGYIAGEAKTSAQMTNFIPRVEISLRDVLLNTYVRNQTLSLYDSSDRLIKTWTTSEGSEEITNLSEGDYYIIIGEKSGSRHDFTVADSRQITSHTVEIWSIQSLLTVAAVLIVIIIGILVVVKIVERSVRRKKSGS